MREQKHSVQAQSHPLYEAANFYMLRAPILPARTFLQLTDMTHNPVHALPDKRDACIAEVRVQCQQRLLMLASEAPIEHALAAASLSLIEGLAKVRRAEQSRRSDRTYSSLMRYLVRMSSRPTPFGLFAGVAMGTFADETTLQLALPTVQQIRTRPDMSWLLSVIHCVEKIPEVVTQLNVCANQNIILAGERAFLPYADIYGQNNNHSISLRVTPVVQYVLQQAQYPIRYSKLYTLLLAQFPQASAQQVDRLLQQLWEHHFLISDLRPPLTLADPTTYILERLETLTHVEPICTNLRQVVEEAAQVDRGRSDNAVSALRLLNQQQQRLLPEHKESLLQIDTSLHVNDTYLHESIRQAAAQAATTLLRLSNLSQGLPHLQEYRQAFLERYGSYAEVPLLDLLSPETGLDAPPTYEHPRRTYPLQVQQVNQMVPQRERVLSRLVAKAVNDRAIEIEIPEMLLKQLERWSPLSEDAPLSLEIYMQIQAASREAIDAGEWRAIISPNCGSPAGGRTFGRFFDLLGTEGVCSLQEFVRDEEALAPDTIFAELSYLPTRARAANVAIRPALRRYEIVVGTTPSVPPDRVIPLSDLVVGVSNNHFYLRSIRLGKRIQVCQNHMLSPITAPNVCRFLAEIAMDKGPCLAPFDWGITATSPFLPRLLQNNVVLCPAQWNLTQDMIKLSGPGSETTRWFTGIQQWRETWRVPRYVYLTQADNRLLLDLEHPLLVEELHAELETVGEKGYALLQEVLPDFQQLWLQDEQNAHHFSEIVVPLLRTQAATATSLVTQPSLTPITSKERSAIPGGDWVYLKLYAASERHDEIIAGPLCTIVSHCQQQGMIDRWFFIRYADPEPHLRIRFHASQSSLAQNLLSCALAWGRELTERGLCQRISLETYEREIERYGGPQSIELLESVFTVNSTAISQLIAGHHVRQISIDPVVTAVFSLDQLFARWGLSSADRLRWTQMYAEKYEASKEFRDKRRLLCELLAPWNRTHDPALTEQREQILACLSPQEDTLLAVASRIRILASSGDLWVTEDDLLSSLAHMHVNRLLGINRLHEQQVYAFWRHTLESLRLRPDPTEEGR